jgi:hypothetical protein
VCFWHAHKLAEQLCEAPQQRWCMARFTCGSFQSSECNRKRCRQVSCRICWLQSLEVINWTSFLFASPSIWTTISPAYFSPVHIGTLLTSSHTRLVSTYRWQSVEFLWFAVNPIWLLAWLIVRPYGNHPFFLCGRPTCPTQYCPLFPGCCKKGDASQEPAIRPTTLFPALDATREQIASD